MIFVYMLSVLCFTSVLLYGMRIHLILKIRDAELASQKQINDFLKPPELPPTPIVQTVDMAAVGRVIRDEIEYAIGTGQWRATKASYYKTNKFIDPTYRTYR